MAKYRVTTVDTNGSTTTHHSSEDEAYRTRVTPNERAGVPVRVEQDLFEDGEFVLYEDHNH